MQFNIIEKEFDKEYVNKRREVECNIFEKMIRLYCMKNHDNYLCKECEMLLIRSKKHIGNCRHIPYKTFCHNCPTSCFMETDRIKMLPIMKYSKSRVLLHHPLLSIRYLYYLIKAIRLQREERKRVS